ncbi:MAG: flagellar hook-length control protein FliK [Deltaproteobacteria bacterium]|nr:flagellar hook-length control protein FliK [Deltaproteobacteria bacterium]
MNHLIFKKNALLGQIRNPQSAIRNPTRLILQGKSRQGKILPFTKGEVVQGRVIRRIPPDHVLLLFGEKQVTARTSVPLRAGQTAFFEVEEVSPQCVLKLVEARIGDLHGVEGLLARSALCESPYKSLIKILAPLMRSGEESAVSKVPNMLVRWWGLLSRISFPPEQAVHDGQFLKSFIDGSGMIWEHKLRSLLLSGFPSRDNLEVLIGNDLKGLALKSLADGVANKSVSAEAISRFIDSLEQFQLLNVSRLEGQGKLFFTIPVQFHDQFGFGKLLIDLAEKGEDESADREGGRVLRVSLLLQMSCLGPVRADVSVFQKAIRVGFWVCEEEIQSLFNNYAGLLKRQLERHGFHLEEATCRLQEANVLTQTSLVEDLLDSEEHQINLIV